MAEQAYRRVLSTTFLDSCSLIDRIIANAESEVKQQSFNKENRELLVDLLYNRINRVVTKFERLLLNYNHTYNRTLNVPIEIFGYDERLQLLLSDDIISNNLDMEAID